MFKHMNLLTTISLKYFITMATYSIQALRMIGSLAKSCYTHFHLPQKTRTNIIALGIRKAPCPYRRSRAGTNLFKAIHRRITQCSNDLTDQPPRSIQYSLLRSLRKEVVNKKRLVNLSLINAHSITSKVNQFQQELIDFNVDICGITETWLKHNGIDANVKEIPPSGYKILSTPRKTNQTGGRIALVYRENYNIKLLDHPKEMDTMEFQGYHMRFNNTTLNLYVIYRIPSTSILQFCNELSTLFESDLSNPSDKTLYIGDFNIHVDKRDSMDNINFQDTIDGFNYHNLVTFPTHVRQHHLDQVLDSPLNPLVTSVTPGMYLSDPCFVHCKLNIVKKQPVPDIVTFRKIKSIDHDNFASDLTAALAKIKENQNQSLDTLVTNYNMEVKCILNNHAPEKTKYMKKVHNQPWFNDKIKQEIILRCYKERLYRANPCTYTLNAFYQQCRFVNNIIKKEQRDYYITQLAEHHTDIKRIYQIANKMLFRNEPLPLPPTCDTKKLADDFNQFFTEKMDKIMAGLQPIETHPIDPKYIEAVNESPIMLSTYKKNSLEDTKRLIHTAATKSCEIDPIPTVLLKEHINIVAPTIRDIINLSLMSGTMPLQMKEALVRPLLKKPNLDLLQFKNYQPISNLTFISKLVERAVCEQLMDHAHKTGKLEDLQLAYRSDYSTEMALLKI